MCLKKPYNEEKHYIKFFLVAISTWGLITYFHFPSFLLLFIFLLDGILTSWSYFKFKKQLIVYSVFWGTFLLLTSTPSSLLSGGGHLIALVLGYVFDRCFASIAKKHCDIRQRYEQSLYEPKKHDASIFANSSIFEESKVQQVITAQQQQPLPTHHPKVIPFRNK